MDKTVNIGTKGIDLRLPEVEIQQETGHPGLDSITHVTDSSDTTPPPNLRLSGGLDTHDALQTIVGSKTSVTVPPDPLPLPLDLVPLPQPDLQPDPQPLPPPILQPLPPPIQPPVLARATGPSPLPGNTNPVTPQDPRPMADKTLPSDWATRMKAHAEGTSGHFRVGPHQTAIRGMLAELSQASARGQGDPMMRSVELARSLSTMLTTPYTAEQLTSDGAKGLRQAHMTLVALVQHGGTSQTTTRQDVMRAVMLLPIEQRHALLEADLAGSKALTGLLHQAMTTATGTDIPEMKSAFAAFKAASNLASVTLALDRADPTGQAAACVTALVDHLERQGVSGGSLDAFANHLAFQLKLGDLKLPDTSKANWRQDLTLDLITRFAGLEERRPGELEKVLKLPKPDLLALVGRAMAGRMEGDVHILRSLRDDMPALKALFAPDGDRLETIFKGLESGAFDAALFLSELRQGTDLTGIAAALTQRLDTFATAKTTQLNDLVRARSDHAVQRYTILAGKLAAVPAPVGAALDRINSELAELKLALAELGSPTLTDHIISLQLLRDGDPLTQTPAVTGTRLTEVRAQIAALSGLSDELDQVATPPLAFDKASVMNLAMRFGVGAIDRVEFLGMPPTNDATRPAFNSSMESLRQLKFQMAALANPELFKTGLANLAPVLPTAGKPLESFHHIDSMVQDLVAMANDIRTKDPGFTLSGMPIVILDQSDGDGLDPGKQALWNRNETYLRGLEAKFGASHGLTFVHVSMQDIRRMIDGSGLEKLFDTTGQNNPGYGGARNLAFLLGPVVRNAIKEGETLADITPGTLVDRIKDNALADTAPKLFMGDDTDYLAPGAMFAKVGLNALHDDEYYTAVSRRDGRDTTGVSSGPVKGVTANLSTLGSDAFVAAFSNSKFNKKLANPGMGSVIGAPRFCFDIPTGAEESHHKGLTTYKDQLGVVRHLSGDRLRDNPGQVQAFLNYSLGTETFMQFGAFVPTWNTKHFGDLQLGQPGFTSLGDVVDHATDPVVRKTNQKAALERLALWVSQSNRLEGPSGVTQTKLQEIDAYLQSHPNLDSETRAEVLSVRATFDNVIRQAALAEAMVLDFVRRVCPGSIGQDGKIVLTQNQIAAQARPEVVLAGLLAQAVDNGVDISAALAQSKAALLNGVDLTRPENVVLRNQVLILESLHGGGFTGLLDQLT